VGGGGLVSKKKAKSACQIGNRAVSGHESWPTGKYRLSFKPQTITRQFAFKLKVLVLAANDRNHFFS
jgi:hypothetical protein